MSTKGGPPRVLGNDPFKRGAAVPKPADKPLAETLAGEPAAAPVLPGRTKPVMTPVPVRAQRRSGEKRAAPKPPKMPVPQANASQAAPARRAVTSFASSPTPPAPEPKVTAPARLTQRKPKADVKPASEASVKPPGADGQAALAAADLSPLPPLPPPPLRIERSHPRSLLAGAPPPSPPPAPYIDGEALPPRELFSTPLSHEASPTLAAEFTAHETSPEVVEELEKGRATPHAGSPAVVAELKAHEAVPHRGSPELVSDRVRDVGLAIEAAREVGEGLSRPFIAAASGLAKAAKAALGLGAVGAVDTWGKDSALTRALHPVGDFLYDKYFRVTVEGSELIPPGPSILVANHSGALPLDGPMLHYALQRERSDLSGARWLVEDQVFHAPVIGVLVNRLGAVRAHPDNAVKLLEEGRPVIVFPEGFLGISKPFTQRYQLKRFGRGGYVKLALKQRVPIVPVAIVGAEESMPLLAKLPGGLLGLPYLPLTPPPLPARWRIRFSEPLTVDGRADDLAYVQDQNDRVRDSIAGMLRSMLGS